MELQVIAKKENVLLKRVEVTFKAVHKAEPTPTRDTIRSQLAKELQASKDAVIVDHARSSFGRFETSGYAKIYRTKEEALAVERSHILVRNKLKEAEAKKEAPKAEKLAKAEKPAPKAEGKPEAPKAEAKAERKEEKPGAKEEKKPAEKHEERKEPKKDEKSESKKAEPKKKEGK